jgi:hypothetical protein
MHISYFIRIYSSYICVDVVALQRRKKKAGIKIEIKITASYALWR